jgi:hypothetical protein
MGWLACLIHLGFHGAGRTGFRVGGDRQPGARVDRFKRLTAPGFNKFNIDKKFVVFHLARSFLNGGHS